MRSCPKTFKDLSFPNALVGNPDVETGLKPVSTRPPTEAFGGDNFGVNLNKKRAQSTLEFTILTIIIIGVFLAASDYVKRGIQGRWKSAVDDLGDQYDPRTANTDLISTLISNSDMRISTMNVTDGGVVTFRNDITSSFESKQGSVVVGPPEP